MSAQEEARKLALLMHGYKDENGLHYWGNMRDEDTVAKTTDTIATALTACDEEIKSRDTALAVARDALEILRAKIETRDEEIAKLSKELAGEKVTNRLFFDKLNQVNTWYNELLEVIYSDGCEGCNERPDPRTVVNNIRGIAADYKARATAAEAALARARELAVNWRADAENPHNVACGHSLILLGAANELEAALGQPEDKP